MTEANFYGGFAGGILIGCAAVLLLLLNGRIAGISGILGGAFSTRGSERWWRGAFIFGLIAGAALYSLLVGPLRINPVASAPTLVLAGLLVGFGTRLGSGCTSGHGVCGLARRSPRSLIATATFIGFAILTVYLVRHVFL